MSQSVQASDASFASGCAIPTTTYRVVGGGRGVLLVGAVERSNKMAFEFED